MTFWEEIIDRHYPADRKVRGILLSHSRSVADEALAIAARLHLAIPPDEIEAAAMLHDIGIIATDAPGIDCHGTEPYLIHGAIGADMLRADGADEVYARVAERHTGAGLTADTDRGRYSSTRSSFSSGKVLYASDAARTADMLCRLLLQQRWRRRAEATRKGRGVDG